MTIDRTWSLTPEQSVLYHNFRAKRCGEADLVDERTWSELEMEKVCARMDRCITPPGSQYLYSLLRIYQAEPGRIAENIRQQSELTGEAAEALKAALGKLNQPDVAELAGFILGPAPKIPRHWKWFYLLPAAAIVSLAGIWISPFFLFAVIVFGFTNILVNRRYSREITRHGPSLVALGRLFQTIRQICASKKILKLAEVEELAAMEGVVAKLHKKISLMFLSAQTQDDILKIITEYLNLALLFELLACFRAIEAVNDARGKLARCLELTGRLDAVQGLAAALPKFPHFCRPEISAESSFDLAEAYHPLLKVPVCNSVSSEGRSLLISGTNMAGKTTFMKTLAINLLLAQTIGICMARKASLPRARVRTLISREDKTTSGQSYFFFEASELLRMMRNAEAAGGQYWFIIDEIFRGTNTVERVAAGTAVLDYLAARWLVVASTHDDELTRQLASGFDAYHFSEEVKSRGAEFDYLLKKGRCPTRNAIKLLVLAGYPKEVTDRAEGFIQ
jgi:hypothetical protein